MRTVLYDEHVKLGAHIVDFHGWDLPLYYSQIIPEHMAVRKNVGMFDVSHMGDVVVDGRDSEAYLNYMFPSDISKMNLGDCIYTAFLDKNGMIIDDCIVYKLTETRFLIVPNAATKDRVLMWMKENVSDYVVNIEDYSDQVGCIAVQGPKSEALLSSIVFNFPNQFKFILKEYDSHNLVTESNTLIISGTGYTGERGVEIIGPNKSILNVWRDLINHLSDFEGKPCGLGSRDTLRMEKGMLLSGTDFNEDRTPYEASISFIVNNHNDFIGKDALIQKPKEIFRGFISEDNGIPRSGDLVQVNGSVVGKITSGGYSPSLAKGIALGYIDRNFSAVDKEVYIIHSKRTIRAKISRPRMVPQEEHPSPS